MKPLVCVCVGSVVCLLVACGDATEIFSDLSVPADLGVEDLSIEVDLDAPDLVGPEPCDADAGVPTTLRCSGLYSDFASKTVASDVQPYAPGHELWSDGAAKSRFVLLPGPIDVTNQHDWVFPVGTKLWKEFRVLVGGTEKRAETRMYWKRGATDWVGVVYRWNDAETDAPRFAAGLDAVPGTSYEIPGENRCPSCHQGRTDPPLGFEAVLLAAPGASGLTFATLQAQTKLVSTNGNATCLPSTLQIPGTAVEQAALGWLHVSCGVSCHKPGSSGPFPLWVDVSSGGAPNQIQTTSAFDAINTLSGFVPQGGTGNYYRIRPTDGTRSTVRLRMEVRDAVPGGSGIVQMPPGLTHARDLAGEAKLDAWIGAMTAAPYPAPGPL